MIQPSARRSPRQVLPALRQPQVPRHRPRRRTRPTSRGSSRSTPPRASSSTRASSCSAAPSRGSRSPTTSRPASRASRAWAGSGCSPTRPPGSSTPGFTGHVTLELSNVATLPIMLWPGMKIGQLAFFRLSSSAEKPYGSRPTAPTTRGNAARPPAAASRTSTARTSDRAWWTCRPQRTSDRRCPHRTRLAMRRPSGTASAPNTPMTPGPGGPSIEGRRMGRRTRPPSRCGSPDQRDHHDERGGHQRRAGRPRRPGPRRRGSAADSLLAPRAGPAPSCAGASPTTPRESSSSSTAAPRRAGCRWRGGVFPSCGCCRSPRRSRVTPAATSRSCA